MSLAHISMIQALSVWSDLEACYYGKNRYGGDTAEIYAYRLLPNNPRLLYPEGNSIREEAKNLDDAIAKNALKALCRLFEKEHDVRILIDDYVIDSWHRKFDHRAYVRVLKA